MDAGAYGVIYVLNAVVAFVVFMPDMPDGVDRRGNPKYKDLDRKQRITTLVHAQAFSIIVTFIISRLFGGI